VPDRPHSFAIIKPMRWIGLRVDQNPDPDVAWSSMLSHAAYTECVRQTDTGLEWMIVDVPLRRR
jgi:hypothetical protein